MKFRDVVLLLVGGGLVVVGMLMSNLIENDAIADNHSNEVVEYEYKTSSFSTHARSAFYVSRQGNEEKEISFYDLTDNYSSRHPSRLQVMITNETRNGWIFVDWEFRTEDHVFAVFKRVKQ